MRVATLDPLRVEIVVPASLFGSIRTGAWLPVLPELPNATPRQAKVVLVDALIDGPSNTFRARLELPNANYEVPAGLRCKVELGAAAAAPRADERPKAVESELQRVETPLRLDHNAPQFKSRGTP